MRPCYVCDKDVASGNYMVHLQAHARDGNVEMQKVFALPDAERKRTVSTLRNKALARRNMLRIAEGEEPQRTRTQAMNKSKKGKVVMCSGCKQMVLSSCSYRHRKRCKENLKLEDKPSATKLKVQKGSEDTIFRQKILHSIHDANDPVGELAKSDPGILIFGKFLFRGQQQKTSLVTSPMRLMAKILLNAREVASDNTLDFEGMLSPFMWNTLTEAINRLASVPLNTKQHLNNAIRALRSHHISQEDGDSERRQKLLEKTEYKLGVEGKKMFASSWQHAKGRRVGTLTKPSEKPLSQDYQTLRTSVQGRLDTITNTSWGKHSFMELRRLLVTRWE